MPHNPFIVYRKPVLANEMTSASAFLSAIGASEKEINLISAKKHSQYHLVTIAKRSSGSRTLSVPNDRLKFLQRKVIEIIYPLYRPRWCVQGFIKGRSALGNAQRHVGRNHLVKLDLKDFFDQITSVRVRGVLNYFGVDRIVIETIITLCTLSGKLPQGAPTSPLLANMVAFSLDQRMLDYAKQNRLKYTRYADDIVLSSFSKPRILKSSVSADFTKLRSDDLDEKFMNIFNEEGFAINEEKMWYCGPRASRTVTGYTINEFVNVPREHIRRIRSILHDIEARGYPSAQVKFSEKTRSIKSLKSSLKGRLGWVSATKGLSDPVYRNLAIRYNKIFPLGALEIGPDFTQMSSMSTWVLEALSLNGHGLPEAQGTAFFLKGVGLVTAAHCLPNNCEYLVFDVEHPGVPPLKWSTHWDRNILFRRTIRWQASETNRKTSF